MKEEFSFKYLGLLPSFSECLNVVQRLDEQHWNRYLDRKIRGGIAAENTDTIPITYDPNPLSSVAQSHEMYAELSPYIQEIEHLAKVVFGDVSVRQSMLTRLRAGGQIKRHRDRGPITAVSHRVHLGIRTNDGCIFTVGEESINIKPGEVWAIDNVDKYHSVSNDGETDRIHLIVDLIENG